MKNTFKLILTFFILTYMFVSCDNPSDDKPEDEDTSETVKTGRVTFFNESSYRVRVRLNAFSGPIVVEVNSGGNPTVDVRVSDAHGLGTTFAIEYLVTLPGDLLLDSDSGIIYASGRDFNVQINRNIEENKSITIQIPQPTNLEALSAFMAVKSTFNLPGTLFYYGQSIPQAGANGLLPITSGRTGIYTLNNLALGGIPLGGDFEFTGLSVRLGSNIVNFDPFTARNGAVFYFVYNGSTVVFDKEVPIIF